MKFSYPLLIAIVLVSITAIWCADASTAEAELAVSAQPFVHPSADTSHDQNTQDESMQAQPKAANNGDVQYMSGGISDGGMEAIKAEEQAYSLKMLFVSGAEYLANVDVTITNAKGDEVLSTAAEGPVLLVKMPPGRYTVVAKTDNGAPLKRQVKISNGHLTSSVLRFPPEGGY